MFVFVVQAAIGVMLKLQTGITLCWFVKALGAVDKGRRGLSNFDPKAKMGSFKARQNVSAFRESCKVGNIRLRLECGVMEVFSQSFILLLCSLIF